MALVHNFKIINHEWSLQYKNTDTEFFPTSSICIVRRHAKKDHSVSAEN